MESNGGVRALTGSSQIAAFAHAHCTQCTAKKSQNHPKCCQTLHELKAMPLRKTVVSHFVPEAEILPFLCMLNKKGKKHKKCISINKICFSFMKLGLQNRVVVSNFLPDTHE